MGLPNVSELGHPSGSELGHPNVSELGHPSGSELGHPSVLELAKCGPRIICIIQNLCRSNLVNLCFKTQNLVLKEIFFLFQYSLNVTQIAEYDLKDEYK